MDEKQCAICGIKLTKNKGESEEVFKRRKTCGLLHAREYMKKNGIGWYGNSFKIKTHK